MCRLLRASPSVSASLTPSLHLLSLCLLSHWACGKNALPCVRALIKSGAHVDAADWAGRTPVHWAVLVDASESVTELIAAGADPSLADRDQRTPLHWAADRASEACVKLLLQTRLSESIDAADWGGYSALHYAARRGAIGCVKMLLAHGASRRNVAMNGELPTDLTTCDTTKALLMERVGMKRQRSLSSANSLVLCTVLPDLARQFYEAWRAGDIACCLSPDLRQDDHKAGKVIRDLMQRYRSLDISDLHVSPKANKVVVELSFVELSVSAGEKENKAMHSISFTDEGLVSSFVPYCLQQPEAVC